jgi:hypothetical protein
VGAVKEQVSAAVNKESEIPFSAFLQEAGRAEAFDIGFAQKVAKGVLPSIPLDEPGYA